MWVHVCTCVCILCPHCASTVTCVFTFRVVEKVREKALTRYNSVMVSVIAVCAFDGIVQYHHYCVDMTATILK